MNELEIHHLRIAMLPLTDAAALVVAQTQGFFAEEQLDVELIIHQSWAQVRDAIQLGQVEAAHLLPLMPLAATLGLDGISTPICSALTLNRNGNAIGLSTELRDHALALLPDARQQHELRGNALAAVIEERKKQGLSPLRLAHVHPFSSHHYLLRAWLAESNIDPDRDVELRVVPPPLMTSQMEKGTIDGFCVGAPWSDVASAQGISALFYRCEEIWPHAQEKVLGVCQAWMEQHPNTHMALLRAIIKAGQWLDADAEHRLAACHLLFEGGYLGPDVESIKHELYDRYKAAKPSPHSIGIEFYRNGAQYPSHAQLLWYAAQLKRWGHYTDEERLRQVVNQTTRADIYQAALASLGWHDQTPTHNMSPFKVAGQLFDPKAPFATH